jgi:C4-dicarboxylate-specific signal transduction histidine kinase
VSPLESSPLGPRAASLVGQDRGSTAADAGKLRLLLVEDNPTDAELLAEALEASAGNTIEITHVARVSEAARAASERSFEVLLLDLGLPESQGLDTLIAARARIPGLPIIVLTGTDDDELGVAALQAGAEDYLVKGRFDARLLVRAIRYAKERFANVEGVRRLNDQLKASLHRKIAELRLAQDKSIRHERMAAVGTIAAGVAHELNSPLMGVLNHVQYAVAKLRGAQPGVHEALAGAIEYARRCASIIHALLMHARQDYMPGAPTRLAYGRAGEAVSVALRDTRNLLDACRARVEIDVVEPLPEVALDQSTLQLVLVNLLRNACHAMQNCEEEPLISLTGRHADGWVELSIGDNGEGIDEDVLAHIFEPLYTTKPSEVGSGLGLALCKCLVENAGGKISAASQPGAGSVFTVVLPTMERIVA